MNSSTPILCPECGKPVPLDSQHRVCPACLMAQALASRTIDAGTAAAPAIPPAAVPAPEEIADKFPGFEITGCLGRGGMGVVYKARQKSLDRWVAIKILPPERVGEEKFAERFAREAQTLARLSHPNIVTVFDYGETGGLFYIVMEFVDGVNLRDLLRDGKLPPEQALAIVPPICEALQYAHDKGVVHRDIKPENLLLDRDGRVKIADFGIAALIGAGAENAGTPPYMAPEQSGTAPGVDHRADIYALGVVFYEMLTGERPARDFVAPSSKVRIDVRLDEVVIKAMEKYPERRYQTAGEFRTVVETIGGGGDKVPARPAPLAAAAPTGVRPTAMIQAPAIAMMIVSGMGIAGCLLAIVMPVLLLLLPSFSGSIVPKGMFRGMGNVLPGFSGGMAMAPAFVIGIMILWMLIWLAASVVVFVGGLRMWQLRTSRLILTGAIILIVQSVLGMSNNSAWGLLGLAVGAWVLVIWLRPEVKALFAAAGESSMPSAALAGPPGVVDPRSAAVEPAARLVAAPAIGLMVASALNLLLVGGALVITLLYVSIRSTPVVETMQGFAISQSTNPPLIPLHNALLLLVIFPIVASPSFLTFAGAWRMRRLRGYGLAVTAAILGIITPPGLLIGLIFGIWALGVLARREVRQAFARVGTRATGRGRLIVGVAVLALVLLATVPLLVLVNAHFTARKAIRHAMLDKQDLSAAGPATAPASISSVPASVDPPASHDQSEQAPALPEETFGPVIERVIQARSTGKNSFLDLDSGELLTGPVTQTDVLRKLADPELWTSPQQMKSGTNASGYVHWLKEAGADLLYTGRGQQIHCLFGIFTTQGTGYANYENWEHVSASQALAAITYAKLSLDGEQQIPGSESGRGLVTVLSRDCSVSYFFKTRKGAVGLLQIVGFTENPQAVKVRYKLVQSSIAAPPPRGDVQFIDTTGEFPIPYSQEKIRITEVDSKIQFQIRGWGPVQIEKTPDWFIAIVDRDNFWVYSANHHLYNAAYESAYSSKLMEYTYPNLGDVRLPAAIEDRIKH